MTNLFYLVPAAAVVALLFAYIFFRQMMKESEGTATMKQIAQFVREGAMAYLKQQYKVVIVVFVILALLFQFCNALLKIRGECCLVTNHTHTHVVLFCPFHR